MEIAGWGYIPPNHNNQLPKNSVTFDAITCISDETIVTYDKLSIIQLDTDHEMIFKADKLLMFDFKYHNSGMFAVLL